GQKDPEQAKELIGTTAQLEFRMVSDDNDKVFREMYEKGHPPDIAFLSTREDGLSHLEGKDREALLAFVKGKTPPDTQVLLQCVESAVKKDTCESYRTFLVEKTVPLTGDSLAGASVSPGEMNKVAVAFQLDAQGARDF